MGASPPSSEGLDTEHVGPVPLWRLIVSEDFFSRHPFDFGDLVGVGDVRFAISVPSEEERVDDRTSVIQFVE